ncbi:MAG: hypothetical protein KAI66_11860 [Lentisphaeria bacterium]|nr:hypothetical protein [Lentisphaeria bacterium]
MTRKRRGQGDPIEHEIARVLNPGTYIPDRDSFSFASDLEEVAAKIDSLVGTDPNRATNLYEAFLAACYMKVEELDDSSGSFGQFVEELYCGWIKARQAGGAAPDETASRLLTWIDQDDYCFCHYLEVGAVEVFDKTNLAAFVKQIRARFDAAGQASAKDDDYARCRWGEVLRTLYAAQKDLPAYVDLAEETGLTVKDCHIIAKLLVTKRKPKEALAWVGRGIDLDKKTPHGSRAAYDLVRLKRDLLTKLGRGREALEAAWADYRDHPSTYTYEDLMKYVPKAERADWHEKAIEAAMGADLHSVMKLFLATKELDRLVDLVRQATVEDLADLSHYATEPVARKLEKAHPGLAARLWCAQGLRIVNAKKSKYYDAALSNLESAKRCFKRAGLEAEWDKTVRQIRVDHHRKRNFMPGFKRLVAGTGPSDEPSFIDQAKARWSARERRNR